MTEKERNCLLRIAGELVELCRTSEKTKTTKAVDTSEESYINPLGSPPNQEDLERKVLDDMGIMDTSPLDSTYSEEELARQAEKALADMGIDIEEVTV